jgi:hypothetical protein
METNPATMDEATAAVQEFACKEERLKRLTGESSLPQDEVPMEIGAVHKTSDSTQASDMVTLATMMTKFG